MTEPVPETTGPTPRQQAIDAAWRGLIAAAAVWAAHMDQWDKAAIMLLGGPVYLSIGRSDPYGDTFDRVDAEGNPAT